MNGQPHNPQRHSMGRSKRFLEAVNLEKYNKTVWPFIEKVESNDVSESAESIHKRAQELHSVAAVEDSKTLPY